MKPQQPCSSGKLNRDCAVIAVLVAVSFRILSTAVGSVRFTHYHRPDVRSGSGTLIGAWNAPCGDCHAGLLFWPWLLIRELAPSRDI